MGMLSISSVCEGSSDNLVAWRWVGDCLGETWVIHFHRQGILLDRVSGIWPHVDKGYMQGGQYIIPGEYVDLPVAIPQWTTLTLGMLEMLAPLIILWRQTQRQRVLKTVFQLCLTKQAKDKL